MLVKLRGKSSRPSNPVGGLGPPVKEQGTCALIRSAVASPSVERAVLAFLLRFRSSATEDKRPATLFDLGAAAFAASGSGLPLLFCPALPFPAAPSLPRCGGNDRWAGLSAPSGVVFFEVAHSRLRFDRETGSGNQFQI